MINKALYSSKSDEWATPPETFDELNAEFGFTLDPCSTDVNCKCEKHFTQKDDGLSKDWGGIPYFATRHTVTSLVGSRSATGRDAKTGPWSSCSSQHEPTRGTSTTSFFTDLRCAS